MSDIKRLVRQLGSDPGSDPNCGHSYQFGTWSVGTLNRLERLYAVNEAIRRAAPRPVSALELAKQFDVSRRTIERDLDALRNAGAPLFADRGRSGGHRTLEDPKNVVLTLSAAEVAALVLALSVGGPDLPYGEVGRSAVARLLDVLPDSVLVGVDELRGRVRTSSDLSAQLDRNTRRTLEQAVQQSRVVNLSYIDGEGAATRRAVDPVGFLQRDSAWFLIGWCHTRTAGRMFRFDRIASAHGTTKPAPQHDFEESLGWVPFDTEVP